MAIEAQEFMIRKYFGTDGIRGRVGGSLVNTDFAVRLGAAVGEVLKKQGFIGGSQVLIGRDTRESGMSLLDGLAIGLASGGFRCTDLGVVPTPAVALNTLQGNAVLGIALTASHNPATDNGFKFFMESGSKVEDAWESEVEVFLDSASKVPSSPVAIEASKLQAAETYCQFVLGHFRPEMLNGLVLAVDTANGATCGTTPRVLRELGAEVVQLGHEPDGMNINDGVGSECPGMIAQLVTGGHAQLGLAHDGDGDRLVVCDESGSVIEGDEVLGIIGLSWIREARLAQNTLVGTVQCNAGLEVSLKRAGGRLLRTPVGDRSVTRRMFQDELNFGGEPSGHFVLRDYLGTGDGLLAALQLLEIRHRSGISLVELRKEITLFPQSQRNIRVREKLPLEELPDFQAGLDAILRELGDNGRVLVRYSGTEPKIRLLAEACSSTVAQQVLDSLIALARATLNTIDNDEGK